jgi:spore coat protein CotH
MKPGKPWMTAIMRTYLRHVLGYGDSPNANGNNFFTYASATTGRFEIIPWDLD